MSLPEIAENPEILEDMMQDVFDDLQRSKVQLSGRVSVLQSRNRDLEDYVHMVAHDLKEPLVVMAFASNLITNVPDLDDEKLKGYLQQMEQTADDMKRIINHLLLFAEVSKVEAPLGPVQMTEVMEKVQARLSHMIREREAQIVIPQVWPDVIGYGPWIEEVWTNYLSNGLKYGGRPPYLELGASTAQEGMVRFWVRDNGPGIPPAVRMHLFKSFNHVGGLKDSEQGLGLSIALRMVEKLGGQVGVESEIGAGSRFFFTLRAVA
jgi:signal transduction histidine kinase